MPTTSEIFDLASQHMQNGGFAEAEYLFREVVRAEPSHAEAWHLLGLSAYEQRRWEPAVEAIRQAVALNPANPFYYNNLGEVCRNAGRLEEAEAGLRQALKLQPNLAETHNNLGLVLMEQGQMDDAAESFRQALRFKPDHADAYNNLGTALRHQGKFAVAAACYRHALRLQPQLAEAHLNLGNLAKEQNRWEEAETHYRRALQLQPTMATAHNNLGLVLMEQGRLPEAAAFHRQALQLQPNDGAAHSNLLFCLCHDPHIDAATLFAEHRRWGEAHLALARASEEGEKGRRGEGEKGRIGNGEAGALATGEALGTQHSALSTQHSSGLQPPASSLQPILRVGYVSPDLRSHAVAGFFEPILANHDPAQVEAICYAEVARPDAVTARLRNLARGWRSTVGKSDRQVAEMIRADGIDILVDLAGHTANHRLKVFAHKPAPVQITYLGYPNTTGLTTIDYRLTDAVLDPPDDPQSAARYTEELVRLPGGFCCYAPAEHALEVAPPPVLKTGRITFGSLHRLGKLNAGVFDLWARVLQAVPTARLRVFRLELTEKAQAVLRQQFQQRGIAEHRLDLRRETGAAGYRSIYHEIDILLDVFPWTGHAISCESLWMGVPVLTLAGERPAGRLTASVLTTLGLTDWIARTPEEYVALAGNFAEDSTGLAQVRAGLRDRMRETLCDGRRFTRELEKVYRNLWRRCIRA